MMRPTPTVHDGIGLIVQTIQMSNSGVHCRQYLNQCYERRGNKGGPSGPPCSKNRKNVSNKLSQYSINSTTMKLRKPTPKVSKARAIELAMNLNGVSREIAEKYTDSELREVLRLLKLKANF
nr:MAG TPA: hypothetical protein [Caudoviricetes sp.]